MEVALTPDLEEFVDEQVRNRNYTNAGEVIRDALRLFKDQLEPGASCRYADLDVRPLCRELLATSPGKRSMASSTISWS